MLYIHMLSDFTPTDTLSLLNCLNMLSLNNENIPYHVQIFEGHDIFVAALSCLKNFSSSKIKH